MNYRRLYSAKVNKSKGVKCDQTIMLNNYYSSKGYPEKIRRIKYYDKETDNEFDFITNNFRLSALKIALLYKHRWAVELFFKWIKQHLRIKSFWGYSENAVRIQIYSAIDIPYNFNHEREAKVETDELRNITDFKFFVNRQNPHTAPI